MLAEADGSRLLATVVRITRGRDKRSIERALIESLYSFIHPAAIILLKPDRGSRKDLFHQLVALPEQGGGGLLTYEESEWGDRYVLADESMQQVAQSGEMAVEKMAKGQRYLFPLRRREKQLGLLLIYAEAFPETDLMLVQRLLEVFENFVRILDENEHDPLTGLLNRKTFDQRIAEIVAAYDTALPEEGSIAIERRHSDASMNHWLGVLDIDHFKRINDNYGHLYGDEVLLMFAGLMEQSFRSSDLLFRYGGEEFVVVLSPCSEKEAMRAFERFRQLIESYAFPQVGRVTVSIGAMQITRKDFPSVVVSCADQALYYAKDHGRNQVCNYHALLARGELVEKQTGHDVELF